MRGVSSEEHTTQGLAGTELWWVHQYSSKNYNTHTGIENKNWFMMSMHACTTGLTLQGSFEKQELIDYICIIYDCLVVHFIQSLGHF